MIYLVLYKEQEVASTYHYHTTHKGDTTECAGDAAKFSIPTWYETQDKTDAIQFARDHNGVIVEAFEFDIRKKAELK